MISRSERIEKLLRHLNAASQELGQAYVALAEEVAETGDPVRVQAEVCGAFIHVREANECLRYARIMLPKS